MASGASLYAYQAYSQDAPNISGALLFLTYIVAALFFSFRLWTIIWKQYVSVRANLQIRERVKISISAGITILSFSVLSYNMLSFLILSYNDWARRHQIQGNPLLEPTLLWQWMSHSTLFEDFARSLVASPARSLWTQLALLQTYQIVTGMYQGSHNIAEGFGDLIALSQILPISYTLGLLALVQNTAPHTAKKDGITRQRNSTSVLALSIDAFYVLFVCAIPSFGQAENFMPVVLLVRALLLVPFLLGSSASTFYRRTIYTAGIVVTVAQAYNSGTHAANPWQEIIDALFGHPAVRALAQDAVIAVCGGIMYSLI